MNLRDMRVSDLIVGCVTGVGPCSDPGGPTEKHTHPYNVGAPYFIRTVTHHHTGILSAVYQHELVLEKAAWIPDDGRFSDALKSCEFNQVEPFPDGSKVIIGRASIIDAVEIQSVPTSQK